MKDIDISELVKKANESLSRKAAFKGRIPRFFRRSFLLFDVLRGSSDTPNEKSSVL